MQNFHDYEIKRYAVEINGGESYIEFTFSDDLKEQQVKFENMLAFKIEDVSISQNIILDLSETSVENLVSTNTDFFLEKMNYVWPIDFDNIQNLKKYLTKNRFRAFVIISSIGLNGWIIAKEINIV